MSSPSPDAAIARDPALRWRKQRDALLIAREAIKDAHASELPNTMVGETLRLLNSQIYWTEQQIARFEEAG